MLTVFSIGLNVGAEEPRGQLGDTLVSVSSRCIPRDLAIGRAEWQGVPERFIQIATEAEDRPEWKAMTFARRLSQDAVAYLAPGADAWMLVDKAGNETPGGTLAEFPCIVKRTED